jgi:hypothetical protein
MLEERMSRFPGANFTLVSSWFENCGPFLTSPLEENFAPGAKLSPRGEFCSPVVKLTPGVKFSVHPSILLNSIVHPWGHLTPRG